MPFSSEGVLVSGVCARKAIDVEVSRRRVGSDLAGVDVALVAVRCTGRARVAAGAETVRVDGT